MLKKGKKVSVYKIKEILSEENTHICCLTEDPFFHSTVLLKVYPVDFLEDKQQRKHLGTLLEKLFLLEHPAIAPVLDSGFEGEFFYYTTSYDHRASLLERTAEGLSSEEILKIVQSLASALEYAFDQGLEHGSLTPADIYFGEDDQVVIAGFGVEYSFKCFMENQEFEWSEEHALKNLGRLQLQLLRPSSTDNQGRELELLAGIENKKLKKLSERFFSDNEDSYRSFSELLDALNALLEQPPVETRPMVQKKSLQVCTDTGISRQQREQVLPHVRQLISEKNHYKTLLDEALLGQNKTECQLKQTLLELDQFTKLQLESPQRLAAGNRKKIAIWALSSFVLGLILSGSYGYTLQQKSISIPAAQESQIENTFATVPEPTEKVKVVVKEAPVDKIVIAQLDHEKEPAKETIVVAEEKVEPSAQKDLPVIAEQSVLTEVKEETTQTPLQTQEADNTISVFTEQPQQWWPAGQEFSAAVTMPKVQSFVEIPSVDRLESKSLSGAERDVIFHELLRWLDSWSEQNPVAYFSHYSDQYRPELGNSREEWLHNRKSRLLRPDWIKVEIQEVSIRQLAENRVQVKFQQHYRSDFYQDQIWKSLNLINENEGWQILTERSLGGIDHVASR
ncbi:MAG: hypothetical protein J7K90_02835 [Desulfuromusa sp.]|nr:hypothetical protein [Desulfuromusa sp.]